MIHWASKKKLFLDVAGLTGGIFYAPPRIHVDGQLTEASEALARRRRIVTIQNVMIRNGIAIIKRMLNANANAVPSSKPDLQVGHAMISAGTAN
jgi:hypothetical protein